MTVSFILVALISAVTANDAPQGRDIVVISPIPDSTNIAAGNAVLGNVNNGIGTVPSISLDANGGFAGFTGNSQILPNGAVLLQSSDGENGAEVISCGCGCNVTTVKNVARTAVLNKDQRCSRVTTNQIIKGNTRRVIISSPTSTIGSHAVICPCGCLITTPEGTSLTIFVDDFNCRRDPAGSVDGMPINCSCSCEGESPIGTTYKFGRSPLCEDLPTMAGGSTVIINDAPDLNGVPLGLFPFTNVRNAPFGSGFGFGGFPGGFGNVPGGFGRR